MSVDTELAWKPELVEPHIAIVGFENLGFDLGDEVDQRNRGVSLNKLLIEHASKKAYEPPAFTPDPESQTTHMRHTGPNFFRLAYLLDDLATLEQAYHGYMPEIWSREFGDDVLGVRTLPDDGRPADAFITNPDLGEDTNWHVDGWLTASGYAAPGAGLILAHCVNPRDEFDDLRQQPTTLVVPRPLSLVFFLGTQHPHQGVSLDITPEQSPDEQLEKLADVQAHYNVKRIIHNFGDSGIDQRTGQLAAWEELGGDRVVMTFDFATDKIGTSSFDRILGGS